ncbi:hypothetical protein F4823DRAFT_631247 [Ustulina deusta]|nr:hypothetical protein F4823DRAFT_631247 [Ustulina deusta]
MASEGHNSAAAANVPNNNNNAVVNSGLASFAAGFAAGVLASVVASFPRESLVEFTIFQRLPTELRLTIWELAMENERRLVHLRARGCCIKKHRRRGCPQSIKPKLTIDGIRYEQVPAYFFVNYECRHVALKHYCIRFSVHCRAVNPVYSPQIETNIIMSPNDILVSWYTEALLETNGVEVDLRFGPQARLVRNMMVCPWQYHPKKVMTRRHVIWAIGVLVRLLGNKENAENLFFSGTPPGGPLVYRGPGTLWGDFSKFGDPFPQDLIGTRLQLRIMEREAE